MSLPYYTIPFSFSQESLDWIKEHTTPMVEHFQKTSIPPAGLVPLEVSEYQTWGQSIVWKEIMEFVKKYDLPKPDLQFFIYKTLPQPLKDNRGNPHIDTTTPPGSDKGVDGSKRDVPVRFNILISGGEDQEMVWWDINRHHPAISDVMFIRPNGKPAARLQVNGKTPGEKWETVGEPQWRCNQLTKVNEYASFVRTDILHAINWDGHYPRLIMSLRFVQPWDEVMAKVKAQTPHQEHQSS